MRPYNAHPLLTSHLSLLTSNFSPLTSKKGPHETLARTPIINYQFSICLVPDATDGKAVGLTEAAVAHVGVVVVQVPVVRVVAIVLGSTPKVGIVAEIVVAIAVVVACRNSRDSKHCTVVQGTHAFPATSFTTKANSIFAPVVCPIKKIARSGSRKSRIPATI